MRYSFILVAFSCALASRVATTATIKEPSASAGDVLLVNSLLRHTSSLLERLALSPADAVPDAILNSAKCLLVAPNVVNKNFVRVPALLTCRELETWNPPVVVRIHGSGRWIVGTPIDLIVIMNARAVSSLFEANRGSQPLSFAPGPLVRRFPVVPESRLKADVFTYIRRNAKLIPAALKIGHLQQDPGANTVLYGRPLKNVTAGPSTARVTSNFVNFVTSYFNTIMPVGIVIHHSGFVPGKKFRQIDEHVINEFHQQRGFEILYFGHLYHVAYHYVVLPNGRIERGRPERCEGAHALGHNSYLGIVVVGNFSSKDNPSGRISPLRPTRAQMRSLTKLCRRLRHKYKIPFSRIVRHSEVAQTRCPGDRFPYLTLVRRLGGSRERQRTVRMARSRKVPHTRTGYRTRPM